MSRDGKLWECFQFELPQLGDLYGLLWIYDGFMNIYDGLVGMI
jgi:hypothetical protein